MKKILSLVLAAAMLLCAGSALAQETAAEVTVLPYDATTNITYIAPEGYEVTTDYSGQMVMIDLDGRKVGQADMILVMGVDEEYPELHSLNDLTEEELAEYTASLTEDWANASSSVLTTNYGTKFILIDEDNADIDMCQIQGVYKGFTICLYMIYTNGTQISLNDYNVAMDFLSEVWVVDAE